jgi:hypothetical protein
VLEHIGALAPDEDTSAQVAPVFLALATHKLALRPDVVVVQGTRGAGKTALFRVVHELGSRLRDFFQDSAIPAATWVDAYSETSAAHPATPALDELVARAGPGGDAALRAFWAVHLLGRLSREKVPCAEIPPAIAETYARAPNDPASWIDSAERGIGAAMAGLDAVESALAAERRMVFASYDHLDRLGILAQTRATRQRLVRALLALWLSSATRYRRLRGKIFLRPDLFEEAEDSFPDASKLRPRAVALSWDVGSLYRLTVRHLANRGPNGSAMREWLERFGPELEDHPAGSDLGLVPGDMDEARQKRFASALAGETMGTGPKKGYTHRWIPARLRDAGGAIVPRSFLRLLHHAAVRTLGEGPPTTGPLMDPTMLVAALELTSEDRVRELGDEYPFVRRLENLDGQTMLMDQPRVIAMLAHEGATDDGFGSDGRAVFEELRRIGMVDVRADGRIDVPDIFRYGYGIRRKGGAKAPR